MNTSWNDWLATRPESVQRLAAEFPPGSVFEADDGGLHYLVGYNEGNRLIVSEFDPETDYEKAVAQYSYMHASCARAAKKETTP